MRCYAVFKNGSEKCSPCLIEETFRDGRSYRREECGLTRAGEEANYLSYTIPIRNDRGEVIYAMAIAIDIGDRVKLEKELQAAYHFQTNLIESSIHAIIAVNRDGRVTIFNKAAENLLGYRAEEAIGDSDLTKYFPQSFVKLIGDAEAGVVVEKSGLVAQEEVIPSHNGEIIPFDSPE